MQMESLKKGNWKTKKGWKPDSIDELLDSMGLEEVFQFHHGTRPPSTTTSLNCFIDWVATWEVPLLRVCQLAVHEPATSDHLGIAIDIDIQTLFQSKNSMNAPTQFHKLMVENKTAWGAYTNKIMQQCIEQKIHECTK